MQLPSGHGTSTSTTALFVGTISWIFALNASRIRRATKSALSHGASAITPSISIAFRDGLRRGRFARSITGTGSFKNTVNEVDS